MNGVRTHDFRTNMRKKRVLAVSKSTPRCSVCKFTFSDAGRDTGNGVCESCANGNKYAAHYSYTDGRQQMKPLIESESEPVKGNTCPDCGKSIDKAAKHCGRHQNQHRTRR